eukprot:TRINITY_DN3523_c0_g1_i1.p2 TRINITY_DN3523_c0_g1~~TRINITY_DN3523_c0_g1_i1.p2  ORF type:complete len:110 (-),score=33.21 TRINITY_DN3523_c0_g1_i1:32-361(-)
MVCRDVSVGLFAECLDSYGSPPPDVIVRTSGEIRLSDFMLWQSAYSSFAFCDVLWPEFSVLDLCKIILNFQRNYNEYRKMNNFALEISKPQMNQRTEAFLEEKHKKRLL